MNHCRRNVQLGLVPQQAVPVVGSSKLAEKEKEWADAERRCIGRWGAILTPEQGKRLNKYRAEHVYLLQAGSNGDCPNSQYGISKCAKCGGSDNLKLCNVVVRRPTNPAKHYTYTHSYDYEVCAVACCIGCARFDYNLCREHDCWNETDVHHNPFCSLHAWEGRGRAIESGKSELYFKADRYNKEELDRMSPKRLKDTLKREGLSSCNAAKSTLVNRYLKGEKKKKAMTPNERKRKSRANAKCRSEEDGLAGGECEREAKRPLNHDK